MIGLGREIANILFDKSYNRKKAEDKIKAVGVDNFKKRILSEEERKKYEEVSKSDEGKEQDLFQRFRFDFLFSGELINNFEELYIAIEKLLGKEIVSETLERLKDDSDLNNWVKQGFDLHKRKEEKERCLFCQKNLEIDFLGSLSRHFNKDYEELQKTIISLSTEIAKIKKEKIPLENEELYPNLRLKYKENAKDVNSIVDDLNNWVEKVLNILQKKHDNPLSILNLAERPVTYKRNYSNEVTDALHSAYNKFGSPLGKLSKDVEEDYFDFCFDESISSVNKIIVEHNNKAKNHLTEVKNAREMLESHAIAAALSQQDFKKFESDLKEAEMKEKAVREALNKNDEAISELEKTTSNIGKAVKDINRYLKEFFGREEIKLELDNEENGYAIKRDGQLAQNLSEGEKTAIAFSYFIVKVEEKDFEIKEGIIFIDDPISSFDTNFIYQCFSLISSRFKETGQLFISTHNFQLFNLVKEWFVAKDIKSRKENEKLKKEGSTEKPQPCEFFMVENFIDSGVRKARLVGLDETLRNFRSEYHYLFSLLNKFKDADLNYADFYTIGNVARRFFDIFSDFKIPDSRDQRQKMEAIVKELNQNKKENEKISDSEVSRAYKLVNEFSHNSDPTSAIEHKDKSESKEAIKTLLNIVRESDPKHYGILEKQDGY